MPVRAILFDLEGVLYQRDAPLPGAIETVAALRERGLARRFLTNTTTKPRAAILSRMAAMGFAVELAELFSPPLAARRDLEAMGERRIHLAAAPELAIEFDGFDLVDEDADAVVMGDLGPDYDWNRLNALFAMVADGARLIALHKNRYWRKKSELILDLGPFVALLEYAADVEARVVGKPARPFFELAIADMGTEPATTIMIGDDLESDIAGAQNAGLRAVQVRTGKFRAADEARTDILPDARIDSIRELPDLLDCLE